MVLAMVMVMVTVRDRDKGRDGEGQGGQGGQGSHHSDNTKNHHPLPSLTKWSIFSNKVKLDFEIKSVNAQFVKSH